MAAGLPPGPAGPASMAAAYCLPAYCLPAYCLHAYLSPRLLSPRLLSLRLRRTVCLHPPRPAREDPPQLRPPSARLGQGEECPIPALRLWTPQVGGGATTDHAPDLSADPGCPRRGSLRSGSPSDTVLTRAWLGASEDRGRARPGRHRVGGTLPKEGSWWRAGVLCVVARARVVHRVGCGGGWSQVAPVPA